jgi:hypothetical protein
MACPYFAASFGLLKDHTDKTFTIIAALILYKHAKQTNCIILALFVLTKRLRPGVDPIRYQDAI